MEFLASAGRNKAVMTLWHMSMNENISWRIYCNQASLPACRYVYSTLVNDYLRVLKWASRCCRPTY